MVMDELKRVSADRDSYKKKLEVAEQETAKVREESTMLQSSTGTTTSTAPTEKADSSSIDTPSASVKSPVSSVLGLFSPKQRAEASDNKDVNEEFFSYDDEVPRLQTEVKEKAAEVDNLKSKVSTLEKDLAVAKETSFGLVENLEKATRELSESKEVSAAGTTLQVKIDAQTEEIRTLKEKLQAIDAQMIYTGGRPSEGEVAG